MTRKHHTEEQIIAVLKDAQTVVSVQNLCRKQEISDATFYKWRMKCAGLEVSNVRRLRQLEEEKRRLRHMVVGQALQAITVKNWYGPRRDGPRPSVWLCALGSPNGECESTIAPESCLVHRPHQDIPQLSKRKAHSGFITHDYRHCPP